MPYISGTGRISDVFHSPNVYANYVNIALWNNPQGSEAAILAAINDPNYIFETVIQESTEGESTAEGSVQSAQQQLVEQGFITQNELNKGTDAGNNPANSDPTPGTANTGTDPGPVVVSPTIDDTVLGTLDGINITVRSVTKVPGVVFPYDVATVAPQNGVTAQEVCDNLKALVENCWIPIKTQYPSAFMTCSFRARGKGSPTSQHPRGQACDIQFANTAKSAYFAIAQWIRDSSGIAYDQLILEYKTTGTKQPWIHISFNLSGNRGQVFTFMNDKNCKGPGIQGLFDLSNT
jgi:hypothetical protein